jgi:SNF2 family DNA or RNA helicase
VQDHLLSATAGCVCSSRPDCGPVLVVGPLSTLGNWLKEAAFWCPHLYTVVYTGDSAARSLIREHELGTGDMNGGKRRARFDILLTSYDLVTMDGAEILNRPWECLIVDEGHNRLKKNASRLFSTLFPISTAHRILLTGTPLQNNLSELISLLQFIKAGKDVDQLQDDDQELTAAKAKQIRELLAPHILRRTLKVSTARLCSCIEHWS